jgi:hypothetical protein
MILQGLKPRIFDKTEQVWPGMALGVVVDHLEPQDHSKQSHGIHAVFLVYGAEAVLPTDLEYGSPKVKGYDKTPTNEPVRTRWIKLTKLATWP